MSDAVISLGIFWASSKPHWSIMVVCPCGAYELVDRISTKKEAVAMIRKIKIRIKEGAARDELVKAAFHLRNALRGGVHE